MKTLKQHLQEKAYQTKSYHLTRNEIIEAVKEWLTQKRTSKESILTPNTENNIIPQIQFANELLEELQK